MRDRQRYTKSRYPEAPRGSLPVAFQQRCLRSRRMTDPEVKDIVSANGGANTSASLPRRDRCWASARSRRPAAPVAMAAQQRAGAVSRLPLNVSLRLVGPRIIAVTAATINGMCLLNL